MHGVTFTLNLILHASTGSSCNFFCFPVLACPLTCQNGGTLNAVTCTCECTDGYRGDDCESEYITCGWLDPISTGGHRVCSKWSLHAHPQC